MKSQNDLGPNFFWVLAGIPEPDLAAPFEYYIVPSAEMARNMKECFKLWVTTPGAKGQQRNAENTVRAVLLPPRQQQNGWSLEPFRSRWDLIIKAVAT